MQVYIINLDRSPGRMAFMRQQCEALSLDFERIPAVDGDTIDAETLARHGLSVGATACFMSHRLTWERLLSSEAERALILEDDAVLQPSLADLVRNDDWFPANADIVRAEATGQKQILSLDPIEIPGGRVLRQLYSDCWGCAGYIITRDVARRLLAMTEDFTEAVDMVVFSNEFVAQARVYQMAPAPVMQKSTVQELAVGDFQSTIDLDRFDGSRKRERFSVRSYARKIVWEITRPFRQAITLYRRLAGIDRFKLDQVEFG
ncbi:MAG: glycosyltransferase family 25 protein [Pigmentiphaga sp.]|uniref:Glycosyl transferase family protein n=1 Tax=Nitratireductor indicus C115 TaxID=1231190 RepID=K2NVH3_9HYPH|nr:glycosyltransferase family 25 protein [Nitratireductor indicus]EKF43335.1 glycosyl transferase family protein [Nitratireductor indicus C115]SFQ09753.1 glycosyl transferase, family 25 [Nitratireductor indicus]